MYKVDCFTKGFVLSDYSSLVLSMASTLRELNDQTCKFREIVDFNDLSFGRLHFPQTEGVYDSNKMFGRKEKRNFK